VSGGPPTAGPHGPAPSAGLRARPLEGLPEVRPGDDLAALLAAHGPFAATDVLVVAHKVVSKAEGAVRDLASVVPSDRARALAAEHGKDPHLVQVVLDETAELLHAERGVLICRTHHGLVCANAGVDASNAAPGTVVCLPRDPDASARALRAALPGRPAVVVSDSFGRPWRLGQAEVAIGCAGLVPLDDWRGRRDAEGRELRATAVAVADQAASAADLVRAKDGRAPAVLLQGLGRFVTEHDGPGALALQRPPEEDVVR
jgi:coenzyme F420-0:L-glutamate ligase / coenzyme F420-1:gamma-L-glutamate ligase